MAASPISYEEGTNDIQPIDLWDTQKLHFRRVLNILNKYQAYLDTSPMGAGKTVVTLAVCAVLKLKVFVVCPKSTGSMWQNEADKYGVEVVEIMTYQKLAGTVKTGCNHPFLRRNTGGFYPTRSLQKTIDERTLFVFDEMHALKNPGTAVIDAAHVIVNEVFNTTSVQNKSYIALLSATPCDKELHAQNIHKMLGIIRDSKLYDYDRSVGIYTPLGLTELFQHCDRLDRETSELLRFGKVINNKNTNRICFEYYI